MSRFTNPDENEVQSYLRKVQAGQGGQSPKDQALARSKNPMARRVGEQNMAQRDSENLRATNEQAKVQQDQQNDAIKAQADAVKAQETAAEDQRKQNVRAHAANNGVVETDIATGHRDIATHADGAPKYEAGPIGDPVKVGEARTALPDAQGQAQRVPDMSSMLGGGGGGAIGASGASSAAVFAQSVRDDRGQTSLVTPNSDTDQKTGAITTSKINPVTGRTEKNLIGRDQDIAAKAAWQKDLEERSKLVEFDKAGIEGARLRFNPQWEPAHKAVEAAQKAFDDLGPAVTAKGNAFVRTSDKGKETLATPSEYETDKRLRAEAQTALENAKKVHEPLAQQNTVIAEREQAIAVQRQELAEEKAAMEAGLPMGYNHLAAAIAKHNGAIEANDADAAQAEIAQKSTTPEGQPNIAVPVTDINAQGKRALGGMADLPDVVGEAWGGGKETAFYRGNQRVAIMRPTDGAQALFLNDAEPVAKNDWDIVKAQAGKPGSMPLYVRENPNRKAIPVEAKWVADSMATLQALNANPDAPPTLAQTDKLITDLGLQPEAIKQKVFNGEISVNTGEKLLKDLYNDTLEVVDPNDEGVFQQWVTADPKRAEKWKEATEGVGYSFSKQNTIKQDYLAEWYALNKGKPGVRRSDVLAMHALDMGDKHGALSKANIVSKAGAMGRSVRDDVAGSMTGLAVGALTTLGAGEMAIFGVDGAKKEFDEGMRLRNRDFASWANTFGRNTVAWNTKAGMKAHSQFDISAGLLKSAIDDAEDHPGDSTYSDLVVKREKEMRAAALTMHNLSPDEEWPITADNLDPDKDEALGMALAKYKATADPRMFALYKDRLLQGNGRRQYSLELEKKIGQQESGFFASANHAMYAGWQELGSELVADLAVLATAGASKYLQVAGKAARGMSLAGDAAKVGKAARLGKTIDAGMEALAKFGKLGEVTGTLQKPLTGLQKTTNAVLAGVKGAIAEGGEEVMVELGADNPELMQSFGMGMLGAFGLAPVQVAGAAISKPGVTAATETKRNENAAKIYNDRMAGTAGFVPITPEQAAVVRSLAPRDTKALVNALIVEAGKAPSAGMTPQQYGMRQLAIRNELANIAAIEEMNVQAAREIDQVPAAERPFVTGMAKVAAGNMALLTRNELAAIQGAKTENGADYFAQVRMPDGSTVETVTSEGRVAFADRYPAVGELIQTDESTLLAQNYEQNQQGQSASPSTAQPVAVAQPQRDAILGRLAQIESELGPVDSVDQNGKIIQPLRGITNEERTLREQLAQLDAAESSAALQNQAQGQAPNVGAASMDAGLYESMRAENPGMPSIKSVVTAARAAGAPVHPSMAAIADLPESSNSAPNTSPAPAVSSGSVNLKNPALAPALAVAERVKATIESRVPGLRGRVAIQEEGYDSGGVAQSVNTGGLILPLEDIQREIDLRGGDAASTADIIEQLASRHEVVHVAQFEHVRAEWEKAGSQGDFVAFFKSFYEKIASDILTPEAEAVARDIYGAEAWDAIDNDGLKAAEYVRMLVESKLDPSKQDQFGELFRAIKDKSTIADIIRRALEMLRTMTLSPAAKEHVAKIEQLYKELTTESATSATKTDGLRVINNGNQSQIVNGDTVLWQGPADQADAELQSLNDQASSSLRVAGQAITENLEKFPALSGKYRAEIEGATDDIYDILETLAPGERMAAAQQAVADRINAIADREAARTGKDRMEVIEGFRAVAGKQRAASAASVESAIVGTDAPVIPAGVTEKRDTPNGEMTIDVVQSAVDLDQLVGSSDPRFPGAALQPRNRSGQASANQREEMVKNIRDKDGQYKRYVEGATTDSGRLVVAPLFGADGKHMTNEAGKPLFYVISGNGRRNALEESRNRKVDSRYQREVRAALSGDNIDVSGMAMPVPVSVYVPQSPKDAIDLAEFSNRDAQLSVSNTEQANRDAASIEKGNLLKLWEPDSSGDPASASNRDFVKAFIRATGDESVVDSKGNLTDEGSQRIERAMVSMLLGPKELQLTELLFNRASALGLRSILSGVATEAGNLLKLAAAKPDFDLTPALADALRTAVEAKAAVTSGTSASVSEFFDQGDMFNTTENTPERQLARAIVESRSRKAIRDILGAYIKAANAVDTGTMSMFDDGETTREDLILKALEARPIEQVIAEVAAEFGPNADLPAKLRVIAPGVKKMDAMQRRELSNAIGAEADRLRMGVISAPEYQRLNPDALTPRAAFFQRILDSHTADTIRGGFEKLLTPSAQAVLGASATVDATLPSEFVLFPASSGTLGIPRREMPQIKMKHRGELMDFLTSKGVKFSDEDVSPSSIKPTQAEYSPIKTERAKGIDFPRRLFLSSDNFLIDGHHQWLAQMDRPTVEVTRFNVPAKRALRMMFAFPLTEKGSGMPVLKSSPTEIAQQKFDDVIKKYSGHAPQISDEELLSQLVAKFGQQQVDLVGEQFDERKKYLQQFADGFDSSVKEIAEKFEARPMLAPLKGRKRSVEKALYDYDGDVMRLGDVIRASIVAKTIADVDTIADEINSRFKVIKFKNRFSPPLPQGYSDMLFQVEVAPGVTAEIQVHIVEMIEAKERAGHYLYEMYRSIEKAAGKEAEQQRQMYMDQMLEVYTAAAGLALAKEDALAIARSTSASNSAADISASYANFRAVFSDSGRGSPLALNNPTGDSSGALATGISSTSKNLVPAGNSEAFIANKNTQNTEQTQEDSSTILRASVTADLFGAIESPKPQLTPDDDRARAALDSNKRDKFGAMRGEKGMKAGFRLDLPSFNRGVPVVSIHGTGIGKVLGYDVAIHLKNATFRSRENAALTIRDGGAKSPMAAVEGEVVNVGRSISAPSDWVPVRYNPKVHSYFFAADEMPVIAADEAMQVGARVFVRNPTYGKREDFLFASPTQMDMFGDIEAAATGPRAKAKANALALAKSAPNEKGKASIVNRVAKLEGLPVNDLFGDMGVKALDAKPKKVQSAPDEYDLFGGFGGTGNRGSDGTTDSQSGGTAEVRGMAGKSDLFNLGGRNSSTGLGGSKRRGDGSGRSGLSGDASDSDANGGTAGGAGVSGKSGNLGGRNDGTTGSDASVIELDANAVPDVIPTPENEADRNARINPGEILVPKGQGGKISTNFEVIELLRMLTEQGRNPTTAEKEKLLTYSGWGHSKAAFDDAKAKAYEEAADVFKTQLWKSDKDTFKRRFNYTETDERGNKIATAYDLFTWNDKWGETHRELKERLSDKEYNAAKRSVLNAHYTTPAIIDAQWKMVEKLGFKGGRALEPGAGIGHYIGTQPKHLAERTVWSAVELDLVTSQILALLYPQTRVNSVSSGAGREITGQGFEEALIADNSQDIVISNVPFHETGPWQSKKQFNTELNLHNYFFARALQKVKPGGFVVFITSSSTMENNAAQRRFLAARGDLISAVRLPNNAFKDNAGTEVTTDIIILRKPDGRKVETHSWLGTRVVGNGKVTFKRGDMTPTQYLKGFDLEGTWEDESLESARQTWSDLRLAGLQIADGKEFKDEKKANADATAKAWKKYVETFESVEGNAIGMKLNATVPIRVNEYFAANPQNVFGTHALAGSMYSPNEYALLPDENGGTLEQRFAKVIEELPADIMGQASVLKLNTARDIERTDIPYSFVERDGKFWQVQKDRLEPVEWDFAQGMAFRSWKDVKDAARNLIEAELDPQAEGPEISALREKLNDVYAKHTSRFGPISKTGAGQKHGHLVEDPDYPLTVALEVPVKYTTTKGKSATRYDKADIFRVRMNKPLAPPATADNVSDALLASLVWIGYPHAGYMAKLLGQTEVNVRAEAIESELVFEDPTTGTLVIRDAYLSGHVQGKLEEARAAAEEDPAYRRNVAALEAALPERKGIAQIGVSMNSPWLPPAVMTAFMEHIGIMDGKVSYLQAANMWTVEGDGGSDVFVTGHVSTKELIENALSMVSPRVTVTEGTGRDRREVYSPEQSQLAKSKVDALKVEFTKWAKTSDAKVDDVSVQDMIVEAFNEKANGHRPPAYSGEHITLPGASDEVFRSSIRRSAIARMIDQGSGMIAHGVGFGKTYTLIALAMELKRLGKANRPMIIVENATLGQFAASFRTAYPNARLLVADKASFEGKKRRQFIARIATGDHDCIVMPHSSFNLIGNHKDVVNNYINEQIAELEAARALTDSSDRRAVAALEKAKINLENSRKKILDALASRQDGGLVWEDLGVDTLLVDEGHRYKNAPVITRMQGMKNLPTGAPSQRAVGMVLKTRGIQDRMAGRGVYFATGTPVSNSMAEAYIMLRYTDPRLLAQAGITNFDQFVASFGETEVKAEANWKGAVSMETRLSKFVNGNALINLIRSSWDVQMDPDVAGINRPDIKGGASEQVMVAPGPANAAYNDWVVNTIARQWDDPAYWTSNYASKKDAFEDHPWLSAIPIMTMQAGMAAALDIRLIDPNAPDFENSKVNTAVRNVVENYKATTKYSGAQAIFSDLRESFSIDHLLNFAGDPGLSEQGMEIPELEPIVLGPDGVALDPQPKSKKVKKAKEFDLYADIKKKLVAEGIPASEIALISSSMAPEKRTELFDKVNSGEVRVVIGSTDLMGVGVNMQERLFALHHLMPPRDFKPASMEQRNGRILRQGNIHYEMQVEAFVLAAEGITGQKFRKEKGGRQVPDIKAARAALAENSDAMQLADEAAANHHIILREYAMEKSIDSAVYSMMAAKQRMVVQLLMGEVSDSFEDPSDAISMGMAEIAARAIGDPTLIRRVELDREIRNLNMEYSGFESDMASARERVRYLEGSLSRKDADIAYARKYEAELGKIGATEGKETVWEFGGTVIDRNKPKDAEKGWKAPRLIEALDLYLAEESAKLASSDRKKTNVNIKVDGVGFNVEIHHMLGNVVSDRKKTEAEKYKAAMGDKAGDIALNPEEEKAAISAKGEISWVGNNRASIPFAGAKSMSSAVSVFARNADGKVSRTEDDFAYLEKQLPSARNRASQVFDKQDLLDSLRAEMAQVEAQLAANAAPRTNRPDTPLAVEAKANAPEIKAGDLVRFKDKPNDGTYEVWMAEKGIVKLARQGMRNLSFNVENFEIVDPSETHDAVATVMSLLRSENQQSYPGRGLEPRNNMLMASPSDVMSYIETQQDDDAYDAFNNRFDEYIYEDPSTSRKTPTFDLHKRAGREVLTPKQAAERLAEWKNIAKKDGKERGNSSRIVLSLFDTSGVISQPWRDAGFTVYSMDIDPNSEIAWNVDVMDLTRDFLEDNGLDMVDVVLAQPPCTDFASSGARWFAEKDEDGRTKHSVAMVKRTLDVIGFLRPSLYAVENPIGRITSLTGLPKPRLVMDPFMYGEPYTKRTQIWGMFNEDLPEAVVEPTEGSRIHNLRGDVPEQKKLRSLTPEGFAYAFYVANRDLGKDHYDRVVKDSAHVKTEQGMLFSSPTQKGANGRPAIKTNDGRTLEAPGLVLMASPTKAYHGTPHKIKTKFSTEKIGTGEGAQAYGWGLYFADSMEVAESYRKELSQSGGFAERAIVPANDDMKKKLHGFLNFADSALYNVANDVAINGATNAKEAAKIVRDELIAQPRIYDHYLKAYEGIAKMFEDGELLYEPQSGNLYSVEIEADAVEWLDWDSPMSLQSKMVADAIEKAFPNGYQMVSDMAQGSQIYKAMAIKPKTRQQKSMGVRFNIEYDYQTASKSLLKHGVKGIRYLDGASRNRTFKEIKKSFLDVMPENAEIDDMQEAIDDGAFTPKQVAFLDALKADDWLGFDYPAQAISAALSNNLSGFDPSDRLWDTISDLKKEGATYNYVVFDDSFIRITEENGKPVDVGAVLGSSPTVPSDADYMSAVKAEDMETAQRMVDEAASRELDNALREWIVTSSDISLHASDILAGVDAPPSLGGRKKRRAAAVILNALANAPKNPVTLYRGATGSGNGIDSWTSNEKTANYHAQKSGGKVVSTPLGSVIALAIPDSPESEYIVSGVQTAKSPNSLLVPEVASVTDPVVRDDNGNVIPPSQRFNSGSDDIRYQAPTDPRDAEYAAAIARGDTETAQRMVTRAARLAGKTFGTWFHGSPSEKRFSVFDPSKGQSFGGWNAIGNWLTLDKKSAVGWAKNYQEVDGKLVKSDGTVYAVFTFMSSPLSLDGFDALTDLWFEITGKITNKATSADVSKFREEVKKRGYDGIIISNVTGDSSSGGDSSQTYAIAFESNQIKSADPVTYDKQGNVIPLSERFNPASDSILRISPTVPTQTQLSDALAKMPTVYREVYQAVTTGTSVADVAKARGLSIKAVENIMRRTMSFVSSVAGAAVNDGPSTQGNMIAGGRPDLALSTIPAVAAVDQMRNDLDVPDVRGHDVVNAQAEAMLRADYSGTYDTMLALSRNGSQMSDTEVAATKIIIARETMKGNIESPADRMKLAMLIHGYREVGTDTARSLAMRRDPHKTPAERHAAIIAEALFTPDAETRRRMRKDPKRAEKMLESWMARVDRIQSQLLSQGINLKAALAEHYETKIDQQEAAVENDQTERVITTEIKKLTRLQKAVVEAIRGGAYVTKAAYITGLTVDDVKDIYGKFMVNLQNSMKEAASKYLDAVLRASPSEGRGMMGDILADLGFYSLDEIDDTRQGWTDPRKRTKKAKKARKANPVAQTPIVTPTSKPQGIDERTGTWDDRRSFQGQGELMRDPIDERTGDYNEERDFQGQGELMRAPIDERAGSFDLNDPMAVKAVLDAFALARGSKMDALMEFWRMSILTGPQTHVVNVGSNVLHSAYQMIPKRLMEATVNTLFGSKEKASFGEFVPMMRNLKAGLALASRNALRSWKLESRTFEAYATATPIQLDFTGVGSEYIPPALGGKFGKLMRSLSFRAMTAADEWMKSVYGQLEAAAQAHRIAKSEKLTGPAYDARMNALMQPGSEAWVRAADEAKRVTFQEDIDGSNPRLIHRIDQLAELAKTGRALPYIGKPLTFFLPFIDTPTNIFKQAVLMSPLGTFLSIVDGARALRRRVFAGDISKEEAKQRASELYDRARLVEDVTNQAIGWMVFFAIESMVAGEDDDDDKLPNITGTVPYKTTGRGERDNTYAVMPAQTIRIGDLQFSYSRIEPFATALASMVDFSRSIKRNGFGSVATSEWLSRFKDAAKDKTFLQGVSSLFNAIEDPDRFAERLAANIATGFVPNIVRQPLRELDGNIRNTDPAADAGFFESVATRIGYGVIPQTAPVRTDVWGNEVKSNRGKITGLTAADAALRIFDPLNVQVNPDIDPIDRWIYKWNLQTADSKDRVSIQPITNKLQGTVPGENKPRSFALTPEDQRAANEAAGKAARAALGDGWDKLPHTQEYADRITDAVQEAQRDERDRLRIQKISEMSK